MKIFCFLLFFFVSIQLWSAADKEARSAPCGGCAKSVELRPGSPMPGTPEKDKAENVAHYELLNAQTINGSLHLQADHVRKALEDEGVDPPVFDPRPHPVLHIPSKFSGDEELIEMLKRQDEIRRIETENQDLEGYIEALKALLSREDAS